MLISSGNGTVAHRRSSFRGLRSLPAGERGFTSEVFKYNRWIEGMGGMQFLIPCERCRRHLTMPVCVADTKKGYPSRAVKIEKDMFDENLSARRSLICTEEREDDEDVGLIPQQWRLLQNDLYKTRSERKLDLRLRAAENARRRAEELIMKRQLLEEAGKALKDRLQHNRAISSQDETVDSHPLEESLVNLNIDQSAIEEDMVSLNAYGSSNSREPDESSMTHPISSKKNLNPRLDRIFSEDEIACLKRGAPDLTKINCKKWLPLQALVAAGQFFYLDEYLKSPNLDLNAVDEDGYTPVHRAILGRKETAVSQILRAGADPFILDKDGASYLHYSVQTGSLNLVRLFVKCGVDLNHPDQDGWTALHVAVLTSREYIVRHLLFSGADKFQKNKDGHTPFDLCLAVGKGYRTFAVAKNLKRLSRIEGSHGMVPELGECSTSDDEVGEI